MGNFFKSITLFYGIMIMSKFCLFKLLFASNSQSKLHIVYVLSMKARMFDHERILMERTAEATFAVAQMAKTGIVIEHKRVVNGRRLTGRLNS